MTGDDDLIVVVAHGRPVREFVHYLELNDETSLTPADMLHAAPPPALVLICCWGAHTPTTGSGDPMTIATLALARGSRAVAATTSELMDDPASAAFVNRFLHAMTDRPCPKPCTRSHGNGSPGPDTGTGIYHAGHL